MRWAIHFSDVTNQPGFVPIKRATGALARDQSRQRQGLADGLLSLNYLELTIETLQFFTQRTSRIQIMFDTFVNYSDMPVKSTTRAQLRAPRRAWQMIFTDTLFMMLARTV